MGVQRVKGEGYWALRPSHALDTPVHVVAGTRLVRSLRLMSALSATAPAKRVLRVHYTAAACEVALSAFAGRLSSPLRPLLGLSALIPVQNSTENPDLKLTSVCIKEYVKNRRKICK